MNKLKLERQKVESVVEEIIKEQDEDTMVWSIYLPNKNSDCLVIELKGNVTLSILNDIGSAFGDEEIMLSASHYDRIALYIVPKKNPCHALNGISSEDEDEEEHEDCQDAAPSIPDDMRHTNRFHDSIDMVIPGTEQNVSNTEQCEQIKAWMNESGHIPILYIRLDDGIHVEVSQIYDTKAKAVLSAGWGIGIDGRQYSFENRDNLSPIGCSICVRAICDDTGRSDYYGLNFFV